MNKGMLCSRCHKNPAVFFISRMEGEKTINEGLCIKCAMELNIGPIKQMMEQMGITEEEMKEAERLVPIELKAALLLAQKNITTFHEQQRYKPYSVRTMDGVICQRRAVPVEKVGLYVPGGSAPLFSTVLMLATPARIAGCGEIILCTPPDKKGKTGHRTCALCHKLRIGCGVGRFPPADNISVGQRRI